MPSSTRRRRSTRRETQHDDEPFYRGVIMGAGVVAYAGKVATDAVSKALGTRLSTPASLQAKRKAQADSMLATALNGDTSVLPEMIRLAHESATDDANQVFAADLRQYYTRKNIVPDAATAAIIGWQPAAVLAAGAATFAELKQRSTTDVRVEFSPNSTFGPPLNYRVNAQGNTYDLTTGERLAGSEINRRWAALPISPLPPAAGTTGAASPAGSPAAAAAAAAAAAVKSPWAAVVVGVVVIAGVLFAYDRLSS